MCLGFFIVRVFLLCFILGFDLVGVGIAFFVVRRRTNPPT